MIVQLKGNVKFPITLDLGVWMFDDRKIEFDKLFQNDHSSEEKENDLEKASLRWEKELNPEKVQVSNDNKGLSRKDREKILQTSYAMSIQPFLKNAEPNENATSALLLTKEGENVEISLEELKNGYFLFAYEGKKLPDGPLHFYFGDGSNIDTPFKHIYEIHIQ